MINMADSSSRDQIFIVNDKGEFISEKHGNEDKFEKSLKESYEKKKGEIDYKKEKTGFYAARIDGSEYIVTYLYVETADLLLLKTQPSNKVYEYINKLKSTIIIITIIFLSLAFLISISVTKGIYKPVGNLVNQVRSGDSQNTDDSDFRDEMSFLNRVYKSTTNRLSLYENERHSYKAILRVYWLKKLMLDSTSISEEDFAKAREEHRISVTQDSGFAVCVIKIDNFRGFEQKHSIHDRDLTKFAIINIASEIIAESYICDGVDIQEDHIALVLNVGQEDAGFYERMTELLTQAQENIQKYFSVSVSASISEKVKDIKGLTAMYNNALHNSVYRFVLGKKSVIYPAKIEQNLENKHLDFSFTLEKKLVDAMKSGNIQSIEESLDKILGEILELNYNNIVISLVHLIDTVRNTMEDISKARIEPSYINFDSISQNLLVMETIDEFRERMLELLKENFQKDSGADTNPRHVVLVETVQEIIRSNYHDSDLCLNRIAEMTKMSAKYLGRIFKDKTQISIAEYINEVRMEKAAEWLENSDLSVNEIASKVGVANDTYFYSMFRKKYGSTPKEYTLKKALKKG
jgi:AraC-like DNA-binding protein